MSKYGIVLVFARKRSEIKSNSDLSVLKDSEQRYGLIERENHA